MTTEQKTENNKEVLEGGHALASHSNTAASAPEKTPEQKKTEQKTVKPPVAVQKKAVKVKTGAVKIKFAYIILLAGLGIISVPAFILFAIGTLPTLAAWFGDKSAEKSAGLTVGSMNCAAVSFYLLDVIRHGHNLQQATVVLEDPTTWLVIYGGAACGWAIFFSLPVIIRFFMNIQLIKEINTLKEYQNTLKEQWGDKVSWDDSIKLQEEDFSIEAAATTTTE